MIKLTKSILGRQIESLLDYHRILEMFMQVVHIFTHPSCLLFSSVLQSQRARLSQLKEFGRTLDIDLNINMLESETSLVLRVGSQQAKQHMQLTKMIYITSRMYEYMHRHIYIPFHLHIHIQLS